MTDTESLRKAREQLTIHVGLQLAMFAVHALAASWLLLARFDLVYDFLALAPSAMARSAFELWAVGGVAWTWINARGLMQRRPWARKSTVWYWAAAFPLCCCIPIPTWALWSLTRPAMKALLDDESPAEPG